MRNRSSISFTPFLGAACILAAVGSVLSGSLWGGLAFLCIGGMFLLLLGVKMSAWAVVPPWRKAAIGGLLTLGAIFLVIALATGF